MKKEKIKRRAVDRPAILYAEWLSRKIPELKSIYDIGAGDGIIQGVFADSVAYRGIDLGSDIHQRTDLVQYVEDPQQLSAQVQNDGSSELITIMDVLEHTEDFVGLFKDALSVSKKYVFVSLPNEMCLYSRMRILIGKTIPCHSFEMLGAKPGHKHAWLISVPKAREVLNEVAQEYGFRPVSEVGMTFVPNSLLPRSLYAPLNAFCSIDLIAHGWGCLWEKS